MLEPGHEEDGMALPHMESHQAQDYRAFPTFVVPMYEYHLSAVKFLLYYANMAFVALLTYDSMTRTPSLICH